MATEKMGLVPKSTATTDDLMDLREEYPEYTFRIPMNYEACNSYMEGELCMYLSHFKAGLQLPIQDHLEYFFDFFKMVPAQVTPNTILTLNGIKGMFMKKGIVWNAANVLSLIKIMAKGVDLYYARARHDRKFSLVGTPSKTSGWREKYIFVSCKKGWEISTIPRTVDLNMFRRDRPTNAIRDLYNDLGTTFFSLNVVTLSVEKFKQTRKQRQEAVKVKKEEPIKFEKVASETEEEDEVPLTRALKKKRVVEDQPPASDETPKKKKKVEASSSKPKKEIDWVATEGHAESGGQGSAAHTDAEVEIEKEVKSTEDVVPPSATTTDKSPAEEPTIACGWDDEKEEFMFKYNKQIPLVPKWTTMPEAPSLILDALTSVSDRTHLEGLTDVDLARLQGQLAVSSGIVGRFLALQSQDRMVAVRAKERGNSKLRKAIISLEQHLKEAKAENAVMATDKKTLFDGNLKLSESLVDNHKELSQERSLSQSRGAEIEELKRQLEAEKLSSANKVADLEKQITDLKAEASSSTPSILQEEEAFQQFRASETYQREMIDYGEYGFDLLKKALVKDGVVDQSLVSKYAYVDCIERDAAENL